MPSKNNIKQFLESTKVDETILPSPKSENKSPIKKQPSQVIGRPKKDPKEKRDFKVTLSLTQEEGQILVEKAGLVDKATYLYALLKENKCF